MEIKTIKKSHFDKVTQTKIDAIKKIKPSECHKNAEWFQQNVYTELEMQMQFLSGVIITLVLFVVLGLKFGALAILIKKTPNKVFFVDLIGHAPKCLILCGFFLWVCAILMLFVKNVFYTCVAWYYGLEKLAALDDVYLNDLKSNMVNICVFWIIDKPKEIGDPKDLLLKYAKKFGNKERNYVKTVKVFGKYFFRNARSQQEMNEFFESNTMVVDDVRSEQDVLDFASKMKSANYRSENYNN